MLDSKTIETVKSTVPLLEEHGETITTVFYDKLFAKHPFLKNIFNMANQGKGEQARALSDAVIAYAMHIDNLEVLLPAVERIANKHASLGIQANHYVLVGESLLLAIQDVLQLPDNHEALQAWGQAYQVLADVFIKAEADIYETNQYREGGWRGYRDFYISRIEVETPDVKSFYLKPMDLQTIPEFKAGQYVGVRVRPEENHYLQVRQYSLSQKHSPQNELCISVKAEQAGTVSNYLHQCKTGDAVSLQAPTGVFTLASAKPKHIFVAGGVGITPLMSMLEEALQHGTKAEDILFIQCARDEHHQIFEQRLSEIKVAQTFNHKLCFENSAKGDHEGYLNQLVLAQWTNDLDFSPNNAQVYFCGPKPFMAVLNQFFTGLGYATDDIHYEVFGPTTAL